jgi:hypothetical protein
MTMTRRIAIATAALSCFAAVPALAAHGNDVKIQGSPKKTLVSGEKGVSYHLVEKGKRLTATVKGPVEVTVLLHGTTASAAAGLFLDKKKVHFVDLKGTSPAKLSTGGSAGPLKTETISVPDGQHEIAVEAFTGGAAVSFHVPKAASGGGGAVVATGKRHHKNAPAEPAPLVAEPIAAPPADVHTIEATPLTSPPVAAANPPPPAETAPPPPAPAEDNTLMMGEPPPKPAQPDAAATPPPAPVTPVDTTTPAPAAATSTTTVSMETESKHSTATYWVAGAAVLLAAGAITSGALSSGQDSSYMNAKESSNRASMLSTANTELILSEALVGATLVALGASAILAW